MTGDTREEELAKYLATVACQTLYWDEPLEVYREVSGLGKVIDGLTPEARGRLIVEVLVFEIFSIAYNCQVFSLSKVFSLPDDFLQQYHSNIYKLISENDMIMQAIRGVAFPEVIRYSGRLVITKEALLEAFERSILMVRYAQYRSALGGVRYQIDERRLKHFRQLVAKNMFGNIAELMEVITHVHAYFDVSTEVVKDAMSRQFDTGKEGLSLDTDGSDAESRADGKQDQGKRGKGFWSALLIFLNL